MNNNGYKDSYEELLDRKREELRNLIREDGTVGNDYRVEWGDVKGHEYVRDNKKRIAELEKEITEIKKARDAYYDRGQENIRLNEDAKVRQAHKNAMLEEEGKRREKEEQKRDDEIHEHTFQGIITHYKTQNYAPVRMARFLLGKGLKKGALRNLTTEELHEIEHVLYDGVKVHIHGIEPHKEQKYGNRILSEDKKAFNYLLGNEEAMRQYLDQVHKQESTGGRRR